MWRRRALGVATSARQAAMGDSGGPRVRAQACVRESACLCARTIAAAQPISRKPCVVQSLHRGQWLRNAAMSDGSALTLRSRRLSVRPIMPGTSSSDVGAPKMTAPAGAGSNGGASSVKMLRRHRLQADMDTAHRYALYSRLIATSQYVKSLTRRANIAPLVQWC